MTTSNTITKTDLTNILNEVLPVASSEFVTEVYKNSSTISISSGTIGTYATAQQINIAKTGYTPLGILNAPTSHPGGYQLIPAISGSTLYLQCYRAQSSAYTVPVNDITVVVLYKKS